MPQISETPLPGVGVRYDFQTHEGLRLGVVHYRSGRRDLFVCSPDDPDRAAATAALTEEEAHTLVDVLGGSQVIEHLGHLQRHIEGLAVDSMALPADSPYAGRAIGDSRLRTRSGATIVAVLRGRTPHPAPGPEFGLETGDVLVMVGTPEGIEAASRILRRV